jgi:diguanylate cyclase (GGDEF)-like protein
MFKSLGELDQHSSPTLELNNQTDITRSLFASNVKRIRALAWLTTAISLATFVVLSLLMPKINAMAAQNGIGMQIQALRIALFVSALSYLALSRRASRQGPSRTQQTYGYVFLLLLLCGLALHSGIFQALKPLITPYLIGVFAVASFTFLPRHAAVAIFSAAWTAALVSQFHYQPDPAIMTANLIHITVMTLVALVVSRVTFNFKVNEILAQRRIEHLSHTDQLTGLATRRLMDRVLAEEWNRCKREHKPLGLIMADVDFFKSFNDTYGHQAGDECLRKVGEVFRNSARRSGDLAARYGGEEFLMILPNTDMAGVVNVGNKIRSSVEELDIPNKTGLNKTLTLSLGTACFTPSDEGSIQALLKAADDALYTAKSKGRNCLVSAGDA